MKSVYRQKGYCPVQSTRVKILNVFHECQVSTEFKIYHCAKHGPFAINSERLYGHDERSERISLVQTWRAA